ncbi:DUF2993 domain-containing protein [Actinomyces gaoshouyii]|uniref:DUF2993 domain-containing protein n=1 Tax=Actinomyces gaoshouyii TaxID=1960083 RepID=A0A8H9LKS5_9ACTO|nr:DUF2993 domain-containing protein [Actinomyces gaoshouyii]ARD42389.1 hypothetical protein B6G06_08595 [Actinomyces gaoshouyii]GGO95573.1 hypothetical protein GCM10011612_03760 [Actinomyces gaoshouyii]
MSETSSLASSLTPSSAPSAPSPAPRRRRALVITAVCAVALLVVGNFVVRPALDSYLSGRVASAIRQALPGLDENASITTSDDLILQLLHGRVDSIGIDASRLDLPVRADTASTLSIGDVHVELTGVSTSGPHRASSARATGLIDWRGASDLVTTADINPNYVTVDVVRPGTDTDPGSARASGVGYGSAVEFVFEPRVTDDGGLSITVSSAKADGVEVPIDGPDSEGGRILALLGIPIGGVEITPDQLPRGLRISQVRVTDNGLAICLAGSDVTLSE